VHAVKNFPIDLYYEEAKLSIVAYDTNTYNTLLLRTNQSVIVFDVPFTEQTHIIKHTPSLYEIVLDEEKHLAFDTSNADLDQVELFEKLCIECRVKFVALEGSEKVEGKPLRRVKSDHTIFNTTASYLSDAVSYGTDLINTGIGASASYVREKVIADRKTDLIIPEQVRSTVVMTRDTTKNVAQATSQVIEGIVNTAVSVGSSIIGTKKDDGQGGDDDAEPSTLSKYATSAYHSVGHVMNSVFEAKDKIVDVVKEETGNTVHHGLGEHAAEVSRDLVTTANHAFDIYGDVTTMSKGFTKTVAKRAAKKVAMSRVWKSDQVTDTTSQELMKPENEPIVEEPKEEKSPSTLIQEENKVLV
jgi:hypothetical protein